VTRIRTWLETARDPWILRRAFATSLVVGVVLTAINHGAELLAGHLTAALALPILLTFLVPWLVTVLSGVAAIRAQRQDSAQAFLLLEREVEAINKFPNQNPNPVLRMARDGRLIYANDASEPITSALGLVVNAEVPLPLREELWAAAAAAPPRALEVVTGWQTFSLLPVAVPELDVLNLYGTEITAAKVVERFPDRNPNPVLRMSEDGRLIYANEASGPITKGLALEVGDPLPAELLEKLRRERDRPRPDPIEVGLEGRTFALITVSIPEFGFTNIYGTDITALKALDKFPDQNPNPVLRVTRDGRLAYANPASALVRKGLGIEVGDPLPPDFFAAIQDSLAGGTSRVLEVESDGRTFDLLVVAVFEFGFINVYGTDVTAARQIAEANRNNRRLLVNVLPEPIADRLQAGETPIADGFDEITVLFADVVGFTQLSTRMSPRDVVEVLNSVFSIFDRLADRYELEKIKTIGDAYMVADGLGGRAHDPVRVAEMGLDILDEVDRFRTPSGEKLEVRVGIQTGPAVAGVIGIRKFIYDVWGDTVNTASRMESHGVPGRVQVTESAYQRLKDAFEFEPRGMVDVRGKGPMMTYLLVGQTPGSGQATEVEFVDGPRAGERERLAGSPPTIAVNGGVYRRSVRCADDGALRYVFDAGAGAAAGAPAQAPDR
jgi:class 3 adenylate cyclase